MSLVNLQIAFAQNVARLILHIAEMGYSCTLGEAWRTSEQAAIYAKKKIGILNSLHRERLAIDLNIFKGNEYLTDGQKFREIGKFWCSLDPRNRWGGDWDGDGVQDPSDRDGNHFEMRKEGGKAA
jgi:hypothetical protein